MRKVTLIIEGLGIDLRFGKKGAYDVDVSLLDGGVQRVVASVIHGRELHSVLHEDGANGGQVVLRSDVKGGLIHHSVIH